MAEDQGKKRFCTNCGTQITGNERFCMNCGALLPPAEGGQPAAGGAPSPSASGGNWQQAPGTGPSPAASPSGGSSGGTWQQAPGSQMGAGSRAGAAGTTGQPPVYPNGPYPGAGQGKEKKSPLKIILIVAGVVIVLLIAMMAFSGSGGDEDSQTSSGTDAETEVSGDGEAEAAGRMSAYELYSALQDNEVAAFTLNEKTSAFLQDHDDLFPAASLDEVIEAGVVDETLEARQITKSPDRYGDRLMYLPELQVVQILEEEIDTDWYLTTINASDMAGQYYYIFYDGTLDAVFEDDWIAAYGLALGSTTFENTDGGETWTIPMAGSYVENLDETGVAQAEAETAPAMPETESPAVSEYVLPGSDQRNLTAEEISGLSADQLRLAINEIYARHGRKFTSEDLQQYFNSKSWYSGTVEPDQFSESVLNQFEKDNLALLTARRDELNGGGSQFEAGWIYGSYEMHAGGIDAVAELGWYSDDDSDYIRLSGATSDGSSAAEFLGTVVASDGNNYTAVDADGNVISYYYNGVDTLEITDNNPVGTLGGMYFYGFTGTYYKTADLSHNVS